MHHLPIGCGSGVMLSLMAEQSAIDNVTTTDDDLRGQPVCTLFLCLALVYFLPILRV